MNDDKKVIRKNINITQGDYVAKKGRSVTQIILAVIALWGFVSFLNSERYPMIGVLLKNTQYAYLGQYDPILGLIMMVIGLVLLFKE
jgi:hypothetical protein